MKFKYILTSLLLFPIALCAQKINTKAIATVTTFDAQGKEIRTGNAFFTSTAGEALSTFDNFKNAYSATLTDAKGKQWKVTRICGANSLYNIVRFKTECTESQALSLSEDKLQKGDKISLVGLGKEKPTPATIAELSDLGGVNYYTLDIKPTNKYSGLPLVNKKGEVVAVLQNNQSADNKNGYALDIAFYNLLKTNGMSATEIALQQINIPKLLPTEEEQARTYIFLLPQNSKDSLSYQTALQDYIDAWPNQSMGYTQRASYWVGKKAFDKADADYNTALQVVDNKADIHFEKSKMIYRLNMLPNYKKYANWDMDYAVQEAQQAYNLSPMPVYNLQKADCQFALRKYADAYATYQEVNQTEIATPATFNAAAVSAEMSKMDSTIVLALLDSAIARCGKPYNAKSSLYLLQRAAHLNKYGRYTEAAEDYQSVEDLQGAKNLSPTFYYNKSQCETQARIYTRALSSIEKAVSKAPKNYLLTVEKALAHWRMGNYEEAVYAAQKALEINPKGADAYKALGVAYGEMGKQKEAIESLTHAKELGDTQAEGLIQSLKQ